MDIGEINRRQRLQMCENLRLLREHRGLWLCELAERTSLPERSVARAEQGGDSGGNVLLALCAFYQVKPHQIFLPLP